MRENVSEKTIARLLAFGSVLITIFMISGGVTDPVNAPKFFVLGAVGGGCTLLLLTSKLRSIWVEQRFLSLIYIAFLLSALNALIQSNAPITQSLYGSYGRNNGFLAYFSLSMILLLATSLKTKKMYSWIAYSLLASGILNVAYCTWVVLFGDFMGWKNDYNTLLGTFGNPNFIGAFLSIFATACLAFVLSASTPIKTRIALIIIIIIAIFEMLETNVMQGKVVLVLGTMLVLGGFIRSRAKNNLITWLYFGILGLLGFSAVLGILQKGPLTQYIYQYTVSLRGQYWKAGIETGSQHLFTGVGFDSFGDWYRRTRFAQALITPGTDVTTNSAHNVFIDLFAFGGLPLFLSYLALTAFTLTLVIRHFVTYREYDPIFVALSVGWLGYQAQSLISLNQLGLAVWGFLLSGALIGYTSRRFDRQELNTVTNNNKSQKHQAVNVVGPGLIAGIGIVVGGLISVPPLSSDMNMRSAQISGSAEKIEAALQPTYLHPQNTNMYLNSAISFEQAGLHDTALKIIKNSLEFNPESFETWKVLYFLKNSTDIEKSEALRNMKRLDPLNKDVTAAPK
jgi:hypothetical protein